MALNFPNWITAEIYTNVIYCLEALLSPKILDDFGEVLSNYLKSNITYQPLDIACLFLLDLASVPPEIPVLGVILRSPAESGTTKNLFVTGIPEILRGVHPRAQIDIG